MAATLEAQKAIKATVTVLASDKIEVRQHCEYAAWYTLWRILPGTYTLERTVDKSWPVSGRAIYIAKVDAEIVEDYYASHFGGVPIGKPYDIHQNAGKRGHVYLSFTPMQVLKHQAVTLADEGYDPIFGARPLKRVIQKSVQDPLAELILAGEVKDGDKVVISAGKQGLTFNGKLAAAA